MSRRSALMAALIALLLCTGGSRVNVHVARGQAAGDAPVALPDHVLSVLPRATGQLAAPQGAAQPLTLTVVLRRSDQLGFEAFLNDIQDPRSPSYHHFADQTELAARFGPSQPAYDVVLAFLQAHGFTLSQGSENRLSLTVRGTRASAEQAFGVRINDYAIGGRRFRANSTAPVVPASIASSIQAVVGLSNLAKPEPNYVLVPGAQPLPNSLFSPRPPDPASLARAYNFPAVGPGIDGTGQQIGLVEFDDYDYTDVENWLLATGRCAPDDWTCVNQITRGISHVDVQGGVSSVGPGATEVLLDIDMALGMATGARIVVYEGTNSEVDFQTMFQAMIRHHDSIISNSWSYCESQTTLADVTSIDSILQSAAASGISVFTASGDTRDICRDGSATGVPNTVAVPADAPNGTAVGGTTLNVGTGNAYQSESWWASGSIDGLPAGGGFGISAFFPRPPWQSGFTIASHRSVPDVSADADPTRGIGIYQATLGGFVCCVGGTSMSAPAWAAGIALVNQKLGHLTGNLNRALYSVAGSNAFHHAGAMIGPNNDFAHLGLGSFDLANLAAALGTAPSLALGDVNGDGRVNAVDALCVLRSIAALPASGSCSVVPLRAGSPGDVNADGRVDAVDALCILRNVAGLPKTASCPRIPLPAVAAPSSQFSVSSNHP
ncbi:MAG: protease pro-enzyme activation domain-containing protein [Dehalococcoidia bacterium]